MQESSLVDLLQQVAALSEQVAQQQVTLKEQQVRLNELENRPFSTGLEARTSRSTSRRRMLRRLAVGLVGGLAVGAANLTQSSQTAQARTIINPPGTNNQVGAIVVPPGKSLPTGTPPSSGTTFYYYGLVATDGTSLNLNTDLIFYNTALSGLTSGDGNIGVNGYASGPNSYGVAASALGTNSYGVYAYAINTGSYAGYFIGNVSVSGNLNKPAGSFKIDHPLDPANSYLYHSFVESPDMMNIYNGLVTLDAQGTATVELPKWFETLNSDFRYGLTAIGQPSPDLHISQKVKDGRFKIGGGKAGQEVSWHLTGIRQDEWAKAHRIPVEEVKPDHERGLYLHPELYGQSEDKSIHKRRDLKR